MNHEILRKSIISAAIKMSSSGLSPGRSGNVSARVNGNRMLITPTGMEYNSLQPEDIVCVDANGSVLHDPRKPSSEWPFHLGIYSTFPDVEAVVHCHSRHATALACAGEKIPAFHYMVAVAGGKDIPLTDYALFGTAELSANVVAALRERKACLLANHGQVATGMSLVEALELAFEVEELAAQYCEVCKLGKANILSDAQMDEVLAAFGNYGQQ